MHSVHYLTEQHSCTCLFFSSRKAAQQRFTLLLCSSLFFSAIFCLSLCLSLFFPQIYLSFPTHSLLFSSFLAHFPLSPPPRLFFALLLSYVSLLSSASLCFLLLPPSCLSPVCPLSFPWLTACPCSFVPCPVLTFASASHFLAHSPCPSSSRVACDTKPLALSRLTWNRRSCSLPWTSTTIRQTMSRARPRSSKACSLCRKSLVSFRLTVQRALPGTRQRDSVMIVALFFSNFFVRCPSFLLSSPGFPSTAERRFFFLLLLSLKIPPLSPSARSLFSFPLFFKSFPSVYTSFLGGRRH